MTTFAALEFIGDLVVAKAVREKYLRLDKTKLKNKYVIELSLNTNR